MSNGVLGLTASEDVLAAEREAYGSLEEPR